MLPEWFPLYLFWFPLFESVFASNFRSDIGGEGGHLFRLTCSSVLWGGRNTANKQISLESGGAHSVWTALGLPRSWQRVLSRSTLLRLQVALQGNCPKWTLPFMPFPGLSRSGSGSQVLCKDADLTGRAFCALPRSEQLRQAGAWQAHCCRWAMRLNYLPSPGLSVSWMYCKSTISGGLGVSSGKLISGCNPPGRH